MPLIDHAIAAGCISLGAVGGALGRYAVTGPFMGPIVGKLLDPASGVDHVRFPWGVLAVNLTGCLLIGVVAAVLIDRPAEDRLRLLVITGFLGSFTTFSAFGLDTFELLKAGAPRLALANVAASVVLGTVLAAAGWVIGQYLTSR